MPISDLFVSRHHQDSSGPPIVLVHGAPDRSKNYERVVQLLHDLPVTTYDRRGYGRSIAAGASGGGFDVHAADLIELLDGTPSIVVGQSAGGAILLKASTMAPELFLAIGTWEAPMTPWDWWPADFKEQTAYWAAATDTEKLGEAVNRHLLGDEVFDRLSESTKSMLRAEGAAFRADMASQAEPFFELSDLVVPRIMAGGDSAPPDSSLFGLTELCAERTGSNFLMIEGASHTAFLAQPEAWAHLVRETIKLATFRSEVGAFESESSE